MNINITLNLKVDVNKLVQLILLALVTANEYSSNLKLG
jgi:hypothetical protein